MEEATCVKFIVLDCLRSTTDWEGRPSDYERLSLLGRRGLTRDHLKVMTPSLSEPGRTTVPAENTGPVASSAGSRQSAVACG